MASSSGISSGISGVQNSGSEEDLQQLMDLRKRKRMISNRESARRSRLRKQKQLDDLMVQVAQLRKESSQILSSINVTAHHYLNVEAENSIFRAQVAELSHRLQSLNEINSFLTGAGTGAEEPYFINEPADGLMNNSWNYIYVNQPIMASADNLLQY
ncbi:bZIP transcription factor 44-like [Olea europaea var. sylvestris]|uniref:bZIP transcription factor 44-like n=1 Tax=Olea europaea var. sylvestris TaxID=158386 RepID=UPI000C1D2A99|nr:bZIP transcription factor 44-like [Olea europaea var. sylvestris]